MAVQSSAFGTHRATGYRAAALSTTILVTLLASPAIAQDNLVWDPGNAANATGSADSGIWDLSTANWFNNAATPDDVFQNNDNAQFNAPVGAGEGQVNVAENIATGSITFNEDGYNLIGVGTISAGGNVIVLNDGDTATIANAFDALGVTVNGAGDLNLGGANAGNLTVNGAATTTVTVSNTVTGDLDSNNGTTVVTGGGVITGTTTITNSTVNVINTGVLTGDTTVGSNGTLDVDNGDVGAVENTAGGTVDISGGSVDSLDNTNGNTTMTAGTIETTTNVDAGLVTVQGGTLTGAVTINGGELTTTGVTAVITGDTTVSAGGTLDVDNGDIGNVENTGGIVEIANGNVNSLDNTNGATTITGGIVDTTTNIDAGTITQSGGTLTGAVTINGGEINTTGATAVITGDTTVSAGGTLDVDNGDIGNVENTGGIVEIANGNVNSLDNTNGTTTITNGTIDTTTNIDAGTITQSGGTLTGAVTVNGGELNTTGATAVITGDTTVTAGGTLDVDNGDIGNVENTGGIVEIANGNVNSLDNTSGTTTIASGTIDTTTNIDAGLVTQSGGTLTGNVTINGGELNATTGASIVAGSTTVAAGGTLDVDAGDIADVENTGGIVEIDGGNVNSLDNTSGTTTIAGGTIDTTTNVDAGLVTQSAGTLTGAVTVGGGTLTTTGGSIQDSVVQSGGIVNLGSTVMMDYTYNNGTLNLGATGAISGTLNNNNAFTFSAGSLNDVDNTSTFDVSGTRSLTGTFTNNAGGTLNVASGNILGATAVNNDGGTAVMNLGGTVNADVSAVNGATINATGAAGTIGGTLTLGTGSTVSLQETAGTYTPTALAVTGAGASTLNGTLELDLGGIAGSIVSDSVAFAGAVTGAVGIDLNVDTGVVTETGTVNLVTASSTAGLSFGTITVTQGTDVASINGAVDNSVTVGALQYTFTNSGTALQTTVGLDENIGSFAAGVGLTQSVVGSIVNRPTSPYVTDYVGYTGDSRSRRLKRQADTSAPCGVGGWARVSGGGADVDGSFSLNGGADTSTSQDLNYYSIQTGGDFACFDDRFNGFDMAFGLIAGYSAGDTNSSVFIGGTNTVDTIINTDFSQTYAGLYATASRGSFFADLQVRFENLDYETDVTNVIASNGTLDAVSDFSTTGTTVSGAVGYSWPIRSIEGLNFVGTAGFSYSDFETDPITIDSTDSSGGDVDSILQLDDSTVELGFVSGTLSRSRVLPDEISAINYFGTVTYYNDFADNPTATFSEVGSGTVDNLELSNLGSYGEISLGVNYIRLLNTGSDGKARQLSAAARFDYRSGSNVDSYGITGQVRIQF